MAQNSKPQLPIGYWLKQADSLLTEQANKAQSAHGLSRFDWQVFNLLHENGGASKAQIFEVMRTFIDAAGLDVSLTLLSERRWVAQASDGEVFQLTDEGITAHGAMLASQRTVRQQAMQGISDEEYATVIRVLQRIVSNLTDDKGSSS